MKPANDPQNDTRKRILDIAEQLLLTRGFNAFSYQHISRELGVRNAAIHYHFPKKSDLGVALIQRYRRRLARFVEACADQRCEKQLEQFFDVAYAYFDKDEQVCPSGMLSTEYHTLPEEMQHEAAAFIEAMRLWAVQIVTTGRDSGEFRFQGEPESVGMLLFAALQGALQLARVNPVYLHDIRKQLRATLGVADSIAHQTNEG
ncbi:TetR/AcrR family transcriptional regulator [Paludibacterium paludis]|uniref:TetR family transcriptional regulator n=1 Tax=Paludibacterium paludis TaxID=1225769 RepID=A0A918P5E2_9NEIS|nr:TetR/AcrR family transcriptional regulator [Paludibacterium paludis]GGY22490.1 TetR family transcriptional regulator [Paludibacterium paludis]